MRKVKLDLERQNDPEATREDLERWTLERERQTEAILEAKEVERIVAVRRGEEGEQEYLVKCTHLLHLILSVNTC